MNNNHVYDMLVVGGGPGGYTAALYAARAGLDTIVLEKLSAGGQMALTEQIDNYPGFENGIDGFSLAENMQKQAERFGARSEYAEVLRMDLTAVPKLVETSEGIFRGKTVVLATGADPRTLGVAGETELLGRGVAYCAACDGMFYKGKTVVVVGGGNSAAADALLLSRVAKKVILVHRRDTLRATKSIVHGDRTYIAPLALTVFCWVTLMNSIDLIPVDLFPMIAGWFGLHYLRPLPTADLNGTLGISFGVLLLMFYYGIKVKGATGFVVELFTAPFGKNPLLWPFNLLLNLIEYLAKFVSLGMRLFGNMYAGELLFFLLALLGGFALEFGPIGAASAGLGQIAAGLVWWLFHVLIVLLQAFIMMMLTLVYIGQAHSSH